MSLPPLFSRRQRQASGTAPDVYVYDRIPQKLRTQIVHLILDHLKLYDQYDNNAAVWNEMVEMMRREKGVFQLSDHGRRPDSEFNNWILLEEDLPTLLDGIEVAFRGFYAMDRSYGGNRVDKASAELNARFQEAAIGYQVDGFEILRVDRQVPHSEIVMPALALLHEKRFAGANDEYRDAHRNFREGEFESCLIECGKAFESVLRVIGAKRKWPVTPNDPASKLIAAAFSSGFIPTYMQTQFTALRSLLESGVPTIRNRMSGHGAGGTVRQVDRHLAAYQLHQTAAAIIFLIDHDKVAP